MWVISTLVNFKTMPSLLPRQQNGYSMGPDKLMPPPLSPLQVYIPTATDLTLSQMDATWGDSGTMRYSGFFYEEPNAIMRDWERVDNVEEMRRMDGACQAALRACKTPIMAAKWRVEGDNPKIVKWVEEMLFEQLRRPWKDFVRESLTCFDFGFSIFEKIYEKRGNYICLADLEPRIQHSILRFRMSSGAPGITQVIKTDEFPRAYAEVPIEKLLILTNEKEGDDITGQSVLRAAYKHYHFKNLFYKIQGIAAERNGVGVPVVKMPDSYGAADKAAVEEMLTNYRSNQRSYILLPSKDWELDILTPKSNAHGNAIEDAIAHHNNMILLTVLATFLNLGGDGTGSFALSKDLSSFFLKSVEDRLEYWRAQFNRQVLAPMVKMNFGKNADVPEVKYGPIGDINFQELATTLSTLASAGLIRESGALIKYVHDTFQLPEVTDEQVDEIDDEKESVSPGRDDGDPINGNGVGANTKPIAPSNDDEQALLKPPSPASVSGPSNPAALPANQPPKATKAKNASEPGQGDLDAKEASREARMTETLQEMPYKPSRELSLQEKRSNFQWLNDQFNKIQTRFSADLTQIGLQASTEIAKHAKDRLSAKDYAAIGIVAATFLPQIKNVISNTITASYSAGTSLAVGELKKGGIADVSEPVATSDMLALRDVMANQLATDFVNRLESTARSTAIAGAQADVSDAALVSKIRQDVQDEANRMTTNLTGVIVGQQVNQGRSAVFDDHADEIGQFARSEIIDDVTCELCLSLDERVVKADDPIASLNVFHSFCRGIWVPILAQDDQLPLNPVPKSVLDNIDMVEGKPFINGFKQLKKAVPTSVKAKAQVKANAK